ncbi:SAM-dependent methyltransferase [Streptomyces capparidis]
MAEIREDSGTGWEDDAYVPTDLKTDQPHSARMYDYLLGGKDNFAADREAAGRALDAFPTLRTAAQENRRFLGRAVRYLVEEAGIRQFLDIGSGLPTAENVHQVAQRYAPETHVVYVDNDPIVLAHGRALLEEDRRTTVIQADARDPRSILDNPATHKLIDFSRPVGVLVVALFHFIGDDEDPIGLLRTLRGAVAPGSHFVLSHATAEISPETACGVERAYRAQGVPLTLRDRAAFAKFFDGMDLIEPGIEVVSDWRSDVPEYKRPPHADVSWYGGIGRVAQAG